MAGDTVSKYVGNLEPSAAGLDFTVHDLTIRMVDYISDCQQPIESVKNESMYCYF